MKTLLTASLTLLLALTFSISSVPLSKTVAQEQELPYTFFFTHYEMLGDPDNPEGVRYHSNGEPFAKAPDGSTITLSGRGGWDPKSQTAEGGGQYTIKDPSGAVTAQGSWQSRKGGHDDLSTSSRSSFSGPGPESVCRAHPADSTTTNKIQGPESLQSKDSGRGKAPFSLSARLCGASLGLGQPGREVGSERHQRGSNVQHVVEPVERQQPTQGRHVGREHPEHKERRVGHA